MNKYSYAFASAFVAAVAYAAPAAAENPSGANAVAVSRQGDDYVIAAPSLTLAGPAEIDRVGLWSYSARGYDLEAMGPDGKWVKLASRRDQPYRRFRKETFPPIVTDQMRLTIVDGYADRAEVAELQIFSPKAAAARRPSWSTGR